MKPLWVYAAKLTTCWDLRKLDREPYLIGCGNGEQFLTWWCVPLRRILWPLCRHLTGHQIAIGEYGYGGAGKIDVFCRYCYFPWQIPASEMPGQSHLAEVFHGWRDRP